MKESTKKTNTEDNDDKLFMRNINTNESFIRDWERGRCNKGIGLSFPKRSNSQLNATELLSYLLIVQNYVRQPYVLRRYV